MHVVIPWCVRLYEEIIHGLKLVDYLLVQADKPWHNYYLKRFKRLPIVHHKVYSATSKLSITLGSS